MKSYILVRTLYVCHLLLLIKLCVWLRAVAPTP